MAFDSRAAASMWDKIGNAGADYMAKRGADEAEEEAMRKHGLPSQEAAKQAREDAAAAAAAGDGSERERLTTAENYDKYAADRSTPEARTGIRTARMDYLKKSGYGNTNFAKSYYAGDKLEQDTETHGLQRELYGQQVARGRDDAKERGNQNAVLQEMRDAMGTMGNYFQQIEQAPDPETRNAAFQSMAKDYNSKIPNGQNMYYNPEKGSVVIGNEDGTSMMLDANDPRTLQILKAGAQQKIAEFFEPRIGATSVGAYEQMGVRRDRRLAQKEVTAAREADSKRQSTDRQDRITAEKEWRAAAIANRPERAKSATAQMEERVGLYAKAMVESGDETDIKQATKKAWGLVFKDPAVTKLKKDTRSELDENIKAVREGKMTVPSVSADGKPVELTGLAGITELKRQHALEETVNEKREAFAADEKSMGRSNALVKTYGEVRKQVPDKKARIGVYKILGWSQEEIDAVETDAVKPGTGSSSAKQLGADVRTGLGKIGEVAANMPGFVADFENPWYQSAREFGEGMRGKK